MEQQTALTKLLATFRCKAQTEREKGEYFEQLTLAYLRHEPFYKDLYAKVQTYGDWAEAHGLERKDTGIDIVATTADGEVHAVQCKFYDADHIMRSGDFGRFF
ncbi:MAG: hypothetical protein II058_00890, partial [Rhodocyclaceae bacterium]|nr:hypothetical protein [Rhodocyclaceae bacterium]